MGLQDVLARAQDQAEQEIYSTRILLALESLAGSLAKIASPLVEAATKENAPTPSGPAPIHVLRGKLLGGGDAFVRLVDLGDVIPGVDANGNRFEAYTTLMSVNNGPWAESVTDRATVDRRGVKARFAEDNAHLELLGVDPRSLSEPIFHHPV